MNFYERSILPRLVDFVCSRKDFNDLRQKLLPHARGVVLELGFGSGTSLPFYTDKVSKLLALDPATVGRKLAKDRLAAAQFPVEFIDLNSNSTLPMADQSVDCVVCCFTLCTIPDLDLALKEIKRVLKADGEFLFVEHGRSEKPGIAKWQDRLTPIQKIVAGGCHLNRDMEALVQDAGFKFKSLERGDLAGPRILTQMYMGRATV
jgi:ubiquinone/menaquinone biosynthesis C-methylase UbiE